jgi:hypothetical protein
MLIDRSIMGLEKALVVAALGGLAYLYIATQEEEDERSLCGPLARLKENEEGQQFCEPKLKCKPGFVLSKDMVQCFDEGNPCGPGFKMVKKDDTEECEIQDSICGNECFRLNAAKDNCEKIPHCGTWTGNEYGDIFAKLGAQIGLGIVYDKIGGQVVKVAEKKLAAESARIAAKKGAAQAATKVATQVAQKQLAGRTSAIVAKRGALKIATTLAKKLATKIAVQLAKIATLSSTGIGALATPLMILSTSLTVGLTAAGVFFEVPPGYNNVKQWDDIPEAGQIAITAIPAIGDIIDMTMPYIFFTDACASGLEDQNGLCYEPAHKDFRCEAFLCYAKPDAMVGYKAENFLSDTYQFVVKKIVTDTGTIPNTCPPGREHGQGGLFCYDKQSEPGNIVLGTWWESCKPDERDDIAFCAKEHKDPCPAGSDDIAGTCWGNTGEVCGDNCAAGWDPCKRKVWNPLHCNSHGREFCMWGCYQDNPFKGCGDCHKKGWDAAHCNSWGREECQGGCITTCSPVRGITKELIHRNFRFESRPKASRVLTPHPNICVPPRSQEIAGLCYPDLGKGEGPPGYRRQAIGTLEPERLGEKEEWKGLENYRSLDDIGVSFSLPTYTRKPFPKIGVYPKRRVVIDDEPDPPPPPYCDDLPKLKPEDPQFEQRLCIEFKPPAGFELSGDLMSFHKKCKDLFTFNFENTNCEWINDKGEEEKYANAEGLIRTEWDFK